MEADSDRDVIMAKIISGTSLFVVSVVCGIIPFKLAKMFNWVEPLGQSNDKGGDKNSPKTVNILLCFGGGVLLATTFLHLLPEINHEIAWLVEEKLIPEMNLNLGELLMMTGFFLIYLIEELVHNYLHRHQRNMKKKQQNKDSIENEDAFMRGITARNSAVIRRSITSCELKKEADMFDKAEKQVAAHDHEHGHGHGHSHLPIPHSEDEDMLVSNLRGLLIVLALSIHELFEGFAVGLEKTSSGVYFMFAAVSAHKFVIAFCVGVELMVQRTQLWLAFVYVVVYSIVSAIGIAVGTILTAGSNADTLQVPNVILQGLATGTLLYVIFFEVLSKDRSGLLPYLSVAGGFMLMFGLQYIAGISESQGSEGKVLNHHHYHHHH